MTAGVTAGGSRTRARRLAMQALYQWQLNPAPWQDIFNQHACTEAARGADAAYFQHLLQQGIARQEEIMAAVDDKLDRPAAQLDPLEKAILLIGALELLACPEVPYRVVINEAIELARHFGATGSHRFINGVLDKCAAELRSAEVAAGSRMGESGQI